jgi:hypothetical protein
MPPAIIATYVLLIEIKFLLLKAAKVIIRLTLQKLFINSPPFRFKKDVYIDAMEWSERICIYEYN